MGKEELEGTTQNQGPLLPAPRNLKPEAVFSSLLVTWLSLGRGRERERGRGMRWNKEEEIRKRKSPLSQSQLIALLEPSLRSMWEWGAADTSSLKKCL